MNSADVVIVGGGIVGLSIAWRLADSCPGASVTVLERGRCGGGASGAAAGMLAPLAEAEKPGAFVDLGLASLRRYPAFVEGLRAETGREVEVPGAGLLRVALSEEEARSLDGATRWQEAAGLPVHRLTGDEALALEPGLACDVVAAVHSPDEKQFDPRVLVAVLADACERRGVRIEEETAAAGFDTAGGRVHAVRTRLRNVPCGAAVVAGGAWSEEIGGWLGASLPVFPVKGQIVALRPAPGVAPRHTIYSHHGYLVPRADGRVIVGSTAERAGFDTQPTAGAVAGLLQSAVALAPALASATLDSVWAGLRPATPDALPILGRLPGWENAFVASGHFRNGILLAPITGDLMAGLVLGRPADPLLAPLGAERFA